jgi:hypothetical protein
MKTFLQTLASVLCATVVLASVALAQDTTQSTPQTTTPAQWNTNESGMETLFGEKMPFVFVPTLKTTSMGEAWGTMLGVYGGALVNKNILIGLGTYSSFTHPTFNMGYTGLIVEYRYQPHRLIHAGGSLLVGYGAASRSSNGGIRPFGLVENIGRLFNPQFFVLEPSAFGEVNLSPTLAASLGASYRWVSGASETLSSTSTSPTSQNLSGVAVNVGVRIRID